MGTNRKHATPKGQAMTREAFLVSIPRAAQLLDCSTNHLYRLIRRRQIPFYKLSPRATRVDLGELRDFMRLNTDGNPEVSDE